MFNDLNNPNNQDQPAVDDIFAETEKPIDGSNNGTGGVSSGIETHKVGITAIDNTDVEPADSNSNNKWFKISLITIIIAILILSGYLVYSKFFKENPVDNDPTVNSAPSSQTVEPVVNKTVEPVANDDSFVVPAANNEESTSSEQEIIPQIPGVNAPSASSTSDISGQNPATGVEMSPVDSDSDGLTDAEEKLAGSNINIIDTDNDGLSDYEEVKIYQTNPLSADTDGDSYLDGAEVKNGYNPNGDGKLLNPSSSPKAL